MWKNFWSEGDPIPSDDDLIPVNDWLECIVTPLGDDANAEIIEQNGVAVKYKIDKFGGKETGGHVIFTPDYRVKAANGIEGTWSCNQTGLDESELDEFELDEFESPIPLNPCSLIDSSKPVWLQDQVPSIPFAAFTL
jgi:hypothetical protein